MNSIFRRVSIRKYQEKKIEQEKVEQLLRAAMAAPSASVSYTHLTLPTTPYV